MLENVITLAGNLVDDPKLRVTRNGLSVANFRVASTARRFDPGAGTFVDAPTLFMNVSVWRSTADNVDASLHKGDPVIVTGRLVQRTYEVNETVRIAYEIDATRVGHDLSRGRTVFSKNWRPSAAASVAGDGEGLPADESEYWHDLADSGDSGDSGDSDAGTNAEPARAGARSADVPQESGVLAAAG